MTYEEKGIFWDRTNYAIKLMGDKDNEGAKFQILGFIADWMGFFGNAKEAIFSQIAKNPAVLVQNKGLLPMLSAMLATEPSFAEMKQKNDGLVQVSQQLWKTTDPQQDISKFEKYLKDNKNRIYSYTILYNDLKDIMKSNRGDSDIKTLYNISTKYENEVLPLIKEFSSLAPDPGTFLLYCVTSGNWDLVGVVDRISLIPFYMGSAYNNVKKREETAADSALDQIEANLTESSVTRLDGIKMNVDLFLKMDEKDADAKKLMDKIDKITPKAKVILEKILSGRKMPDEEYTGKDNDALKKSFMDLYKKAYSDEKVQKLVLSGNDWQDKEDKFTQFREGAPGTVIGTQQNYKYRLLQVDVAILDSDEKRYAKVITVLFRQDCDANWKNIGKPYLYSTAYRFRMMTANI